MSIHWSLKTCAFVGSVGTLSCIFAALRTADLSLLAGGIAGTTLLLSLQAYWIYFEEKSRGRLRKRVELFEKIDALLGSLKHDNGKED